MRMLGARLRGDSLVGQVERQSGGEAALSVLLGLTIKHKVPGRIALRDLVRVEAKRPDKFAGAALGIGLGATLVGFFVVMAQWDDAFGGRRNARIATLAGESRWP